MADILQQFPIKASRERVFDAVSTPAGLDRWWTNRSTGTPVIGAEFQLWFGPEYDWRAVVSRCVPGSEFELELVVASEDWRGTRVGFVLDGQEGVTQLRFHHVGWPDANEHYRVSCHCWALYLRVLRRNLEYGEMVPYEARLDA